MRDALRESRFLRLMFVVAILGWSLLAWTWLIRRPMVQAVLLLYFFHLFTWYFALMTREGFRTHRRLSGTRAADTAWRIADQGAQGVLLFCQILFLLAVFRLLQGA